jgi:hypothetical protein
MVLKYDLGGDFTLEKLASHWSTRERHYVRNKYNCTRRISAKLSNELPNSLPSTHPRLKEPCDKSRRKVTKKTIPTKKNRTKKSKKKDSPKKNIISSLSFTTPIGDIDQLREHFNDIDISEDQFVNFTTTTNGDFMRVHLNLRRNAPKYATNVTWKDLKCEEVFTGIKTKCKVGSNPKVFVRGFTNFRDYLYAVQQGDVDDASFEHLWQLIFKMQKELPSLKLRNHNLDVNILHFKFV